MNSEPHIVPRIAIRSIASGLLMMAFFTTMWAGIANAGLNGRDHRIEIIFFSILCAVFVANAVRLFSISKRFPALTTDADKEEGKRSGKWFGIIFGAEGLGIFVAINIVVNMGHSDLTIPVIALVVGLHFYPLAKVFKRKLDYYMATRATLIALCGIIFTLNKTMTAANVSAFVGIGLAIATSGYGLYMIYNGRRLSKMSQPDAGMCLTNQCHR